MRMLSDINTFSEVVALIYSAGLDPSRWQDVLHRLHREAGGTATHIFGYDFETGMNLGFVTAGYEEAFLKSYGEHYCHKNVWAEGWMQRGSGRATYSQQMCPQDELVKTEFYNDWVKPQEDLRAGGGVLFHKSQSRMFALGGNIRKKDEDKLEGDWMRVVELLKPHLERAFDINRRLAGRSLVETLPGRLPGAARAVVLVLNESGQLLYASDAAGEHLAGGGFFRCDPLNRVMLVEKEAEATLRQALHALQESCVLPALRCNSRASRFLKTYEFIGFVGEAQAPPELGFICGAEEKCLLITMTQADVVHGPVHDFAHVYRLTPAETEVALKLAEGLSANEIAQLRCASIATVRNQIKSAMTKCGVRRQLDLVRVMERRRPLSDHVK